MENVYIVNSLRTPGCKKDKGAFKNTRPDDLLSFILKTVVDKTKNANTDFIEDVLVGCAFPEAEQGLNVARNATLMAGFPEKIPAATVNRFCSSGLETVAMIYAKIKSGLINAGIAGGVESMSCVPMSGNVIRPHPDYSASFPSLYVSMGITAENVAKRYNVSRQEQDEFAVKSHQKAANAQKNNFFNEIVPTPYVDYDENGKRVSKIMDHDDGVRAGTSMEILSKLRPVFKTTGSVTAGNSSQMTDGAAATIVASESIVKDFNLDKMALVRDYVVAGCAPDEMGVGPAVAIPALLKRNNIEVSDVDLFEVNEAFASQAFYCQRLLKIDDDKININGGAIALGHPLGCTGNKLLATLLANLKRCNKSVGVVSMCIGGGMGAAMLVEMV